MKPLCTACATRPRLRPGPARYPPRRRHSRQHQGRMSRGHHLHLFCSLRIDNIFGNIISNKSKFKGFPPPPLPPVHPARWSIWILIHTIVLKEKFWQFEENFQLISQYTWSGIRKKFAFQIQTFLIYAYSTVEQFSIQSLAWKTLFSFLICIHCSALEKLFSWSGIGFPNSKMEVIIPELFKWSN